MDASASESNTGMGRRIRAIFVGSIGNLIEWYDFYAYAAFSLYFAKSFFPDGDELAQQLNTSIVFAASYLIRPFGGWFFGMMADRYGRRLSLTLSVAMMCLGSLVIAVCPTYGTIGVVAPVLLSLARLLQGVSLGGEYAASATYVSEMADKKNRGFYCSFLYVTLIGGQLCAILVLIVLQYFLLSADELRAWGWRIPFAIGALLSLVGVLLRSNLDETSQFKAESGKTKREYSLKTLFKYPREALLVMGLTMGGTVAFYTFTIYMQVFLKLTVKLTDLQTTAVTAGTLVFALILQPLYGALSDRIGRKPLLIGFGLFGTLGTYPLLLALHGATTPLECFFLICLAWVFVSGYTSINAVVKAELFPTEIRATGVGIPYGIAVSIFGGSASPIALWFKSQGHENYFYYYITTCIFLGFLIFISMRDTKKTSRID
jgi:MHS family alpha-ketoglutarate permease-like MFS transporter